jgi:hypothetical protein
MLAIKDASGVTIRSTKTPRGPRGLAHPLQRRVQAPPSGAESARKPRGTEVSGARVKDQPFHTNRFHSKQKRPVAHFPNGSRLHTWHRAPCLYKACKWTAFQAGSADWQAASDSSRRDRCSRCRLLRCFQPVVGLDYFHPLKLPQTDDSHAHARFARLRSQFVNAGDLYRSREVPHDSK